MGLQCTLYWSSPNVGPPSPPASPEKEVATNGLNGNATDAAKTLQTILQQRLQQYAGSKQLMLRTPLTTVQVPTRPTPGMKRKESPPLPKPDLYSQVSKRMCVIPSTHMMCPSPNGNTLTPSVTSSSHNSNSPNQSSQNEDGQLLIDEEREDHDDDSIEDLLKKERHQLHELSQHHHLLTPPTSLPHIPKDLAQHIQIATKNLAQQKLLVPGGLLNGKNLQGIKIGTLPGKPSAHHTNQQLGHQIAQNSEIISSAQKLLVSNNDSPFAKSVLQSWFQSQLQSQQNSSIHSNTDIKEENDSDIEQIIGDDSDAEGTNQFSLSAMKGGKTGMCSASSLVPAGQGQFGNSPPTGATREKMEQFISNRGKTMDLELLRQRFSNPLARPTLTKFVYALTRLLFSDEEIIAPLRDLDQEKIDWIFDETYRMFPGCTYPTVKNAVGQVGRTKRYRAKYALGAKQVGGGMLQFGDSNINLLQGLPSLLSNLPTNVQGQFLTLPTITTDVGEMERVDAD